MLSAVSAFNLPRALPGSRPLVAAGAAVLVALVEVPHVVRDALWQDEVASARILQQPTLGDALQRVHATESTPPLWYLVAWSAHHAGLPITEVRLLSLVFMSLTAALVVVLAHRLVPLPLAGLAGVLIALGAQFTFHGHELRAYALLTLLAVAFALLLMSLVIHPSLRGEVALTVCTAAGVLTHYFFWLTLLAGAVWLWLDPQARAVRRRASLAIAVGAAAFLPFVALAHSQYRQDRFWWIGPFAFRRVVTTPFRLFALPAHGVAPPVFFATMVLAGLLCFRSWSGRCNIALAFGPLLLAGLVWGLGIKVFSIRNLIECGPFFAIMIVTAINVAPGRTRIALALATTAVALYGYLWSARATPVPFDRIASALVTEGWHPDDPVALFGSFFDFRSPLEWYLPTHPPLGLAEPTSSRCPNLYVIGRRAGRYFVERLHPLMATDRIRSLRNAVFLSDPLHGGCVRSVKEGLFSAYPFAQFSSGLQ